MKIAIIGHSGSGKSTLARRLADEMGVEPMYLDSVHFLPGWAERDSEEARGIVRDELSKPDWVIDGNYRLLLCEERLEAADEILFFNYPRLICLFRALKRYHQFKDKTRESAGEGCIEKIDFEFIWWILHRGRTRAKRRGYKDVLLRYPNKTVELKNDRDLERYLRQRAEGKAHI